MRAKQTSASIVIAALGLGLLATGCGPIAFTDSINFKLAAPEPEPEPEPQSHAKLSGDHIIIDEKIQFEYDSAAIDRRSFLILDDVVKVMKENPQIEEIDVIGHTSSEGSKKHNMELSRDRAKTVADYLVAHGIDASRVTSEGKGPTEPIADNDTDEGKEANRRVEFKVTKMAGAEGAEAEAPKKAGARGKPGA